MKKNAIRKYVVISLLLCFGFARDAVSQPKATVEKVVGNIYKITCTDQSSANVVALIGDDGTLLVDAGYVSTKDTLFSVLKTLGNKSLRFVINTHAHGDHVGGNLLLGNVATIIAHKNTRSRLTTPESFVTVGTAPELLPTVALDDELTLHLNGEEVRIVHRPESHSDGDVFVHFVKSKVVATGDLLFADMFPYVALQQRATVKNYLATIRFFTDSFDAGTIFIPSHGRTYNIDDLRKYESMMVETVGLVKRETESGQSLEAMKKKDILKDWTSWNGPWPTTQKDAWIETIHSELTGKGNQHKIRIEEAIVGTIRQEGVEAGIQQYRELKRTKPEEYDFQEPRLNILGYLLLQERRFQDAIRIFQLNVEMFPDAWNAYDSLAEGYMLNGQKDLAIENYEHSLKINPGNTNAVDKLKELRGQK